jgi:UDP-N-acetyl-2-amino-2-deoxyglucuronate dehydrogenase
LALIGAGGYVAPRHMRAIATVGGDLKAILDPKDSVGLIDRNFPEAGFCTESERVDRGGCTGGEEITVQYRAYCTAP